MQSTRIQYINIFIVRIRSILPYYSYVNSKVRLYWCVAYLPSEASIIEH
jgi:hypothetical protein